MSTTRLVFSGSGGQGVITAAIILAESAALYGDQYATQTQAYGAAARGGATRSDMVISDYPINYPGVIQPNILVTLTQEAYSKFASIIRPGGLLLADSRYVESRKTDAIDLDLPMYDLVMEKIGKPIVYNVCVLGTLIGVTNLLEPEIVLKTIKERVPAAFMDMNMKAFDLGLELGREHPRRYLV